MKGLLIKDFKLMMMQKNFFAMIVVIAVVMTVFTDDIAFPLGFLTFVVSMFTLSTISYDEFDNGNAFLFSLPVSVPAMSLKNTALRCFWEEEPGFSQLSWQWEL